MARPGGEGGGRHGWKRGVLVVDWGMGLGSRDAGLVKGLAD